MGEMSKGPECAMDGPLTGGARRRRRRILPAGIKAVAGAHCVVPEKLLAAVGPGFCAERDEKHCLEEPRTLDAGPARLAGPLVYRPTLWETRSPGDRSGRKVRPRSGVQLCKIQGTPMDPKAEDAGALFPNGGRALGLAAQGTQEEAVRKDGDHPSPS